MIQFNTLNVKWSNVQVNILQVGIKYGTEKTLDLSFNVIENSNDETNFPHKLLLTNTQVSRIHKAFANVSSTNKLLYNFRKLSCMKWDFLGPLLKTGLLLLKNVPKLLAKSVLIPLGWIASASATDAAIQKKMFGSTMTTLIISNEELGDIMKIVKSLEESDLLTKSVSKTITNEAKEQKDRFLSMLLGTLCASLLGNLLKGKGIIRAGEGTIRTSKGIIRAGQEF